MRRETALVAAVASAAILTLSSCRGAPATPRIQQIRDRGFLVCGILPGVAGFAQATPEGGYRGFDIDVCRAVAAAVTGDADKIRFREIETLDEMLASPEIDLASRRLTVSLRREGLGVLFGPVTFYDAQSFLVPPRSAVLGANQLAGVPVCVAQGSEHDLTLTAHFRRTGMPLQKVAVENGQRAGEALVSGKCDAFSADISELASVRSRLPEAAGYRILPDRISDEPLAQLVRASDLDLYAVLRWTVFAMIEAEELGVTSANVAHKASAPDPAVRRLLGLAPGNGAALGLDEQWAERVVRAVGNYGEMYDRHLGPGTSIGLERGLNRLAKDGGRMIALPLR